MSNKNPYEVRLEVLKMAKEMLDKQYEVNLKTAKEYIKFMKDSGQPFMGQIDEYIPEMYKPEAVMEKANELYQFITKKD